MKDTGIIRRIDELGRIVIPKEIRKVFKLHVGTQMEIYISKEGYLMLKKHSEINEIREFAETFASALSLNINKGVLICDLEKVLACSKLSKKEYFGKAISRDLESLILERKSYILNVSEKATTYAIIQDDKNKYTNQIIVPIIASSDVVGAIIMISTDENLEFTASDVKVTQTVATLLASIIE